VALRLGNILGMDINEIVAENIRIRLAAKRQTVGWLQNAVRPTSSGIYDFFNPNRPNRSMKVDMLAEIADKLNAPIGALLVPPDRSEATAAILRILDSDEPFQSEAVGTLVSKLVELSMRMQTPAQGPVDTPEDDRDQLS